MNERRYWFRKRSNEKGWGLGPGSPEGWVAILALFVVDIGGIAILKHLVAQWVLILWVFGWLAAFLALVILKGEPFWKSSKDPSQ